MATASIFDCDPTSSADLPQRQIVTYDDDDLFSFGCDEIDSVSKNLKLKVTIDNAGGANVSRFKRKRTIDDDEDNDDSDGTKQASDENFYHERKKKRISCVASCSSSKTIGTTTAASTSKVLTTSITRTIENQQNTESKTGSETEPYKLIKQIGEGTYGRVFRGLCNSTKTVVAIKRLKCKLNTPNTDSQLDFIKREYNNLMEMQDCENVVRLYTGRELQLAKNELTIDLLFEYCPYDLKKLILNRQINFRLNEIKTFLRQMLLGLSEIHSKLIMHRDIKTENILLTVNGVVKIADFGLSRKMVDPLTTFEKVQYTSEVVTQWYRSPEILLGERQYNERIDMWSMGCIMGEFWQRDAILQGENQIDQIRLISKLCGSMTPENWPNIVNLRVYKSIVQLPKSIRQTRYFLKDKLPKVTDDQANHFFDKLMICNPDKRLSAEQALNDEFFYTVPLPMKNLNSFMQRIIPILRA